MATVSVMFINAITEANKSAKAIVDPANKALAYASIAQALAQTGGVETNSKTDDTKEGGATNVVNMSEGKSSLKNRPAAQAAKQEIKAETPAPASIEEANVSSPITEEPLLTTEWNEQNMAAFQEELNFITARQSAYTEKQLDECVVAFSDGVLKTIEDLNPLNIKGFVAFIEQCEADEPASA